MSQTADTIKDESNCHGNCNCCRTKQTPREEGQRRQLQNRLNRMIGQLGGISRMLEENRYCGDILTQVAAVDILFFRNTWRPVWPRRFERAMTRSWRKRLS